MPSPNVATAIPVGLSSMQALFMNSYQLTWAQVLGALLLCCQ